MYRPEGWENPHPAIASGLPTNDWCYSQYDLADAYEAGVNAILTYLLSQEHQDWLATAEGEQAKGQWVFIPEESNDDNQN